MLKRLYADNYRCLVNFEIEFGELNLLMGPNGSGKSSLFDLLFKIRRLLIDRASITDLFPAEDRCAWITSPKQSFEIDVQGDAGLFSYLLQLEHLDAIGKMKISREQLLLDNKPLFKLERWRSYPVQ